MARYKLTLAAAQDFENIFEFGIDRFGFPQALEYQSGMKDCFEQITEKPKLYQNVDHIREGYRRRVYQAHSIYYKVEDGLVLIIRILSRENPAKALPK